jgi:hypothetical protein
MNIPKNFKNTAIIALILLACPQLASAHGEEVFIEIILIFGVAPFFICSLTSSFIAFWAAQGTWNKLSRWLKGIIVIIVFLTFLIFLSLCFILPLQFILPMLFISSIFLAIELFVVYRKAKSLSLGMMAIFNVVIFGLIAIYYYFLT